MKTRNIENAFEGQANESK